MQETQFPNKPISEWVRMIDEWIFNEKDRAILKWSLLDGHTIAQIAQRLDMSDKQIQRRLKKAKEQLFSRI